MMKTDLQKAYDSAFWEAIQEILEHYEFPPQFNPWIMACIESTSLAMRINDNQYGYFMVRKG